MATDSLKAVCIEEGSPDMPTLAAITLYYTQMHWPSKILSEKIDGKGAYFGCKSTTLESVGMILPMIMFPDWIWAEM